MRRVVAEMTRLHKAELVAEMEHILEEDLHRALAADENNVRRMLSHLLRRMALATILRALKTFSQQEIEASKGAAGETVFSVGAGLKAAMPQLRDCGGARRFLLAAPASLSPLQLADQLAAKVQQRPTVVANAEDDVLLCCEMEQLSLRRVARAVLGRPVPKRGSRLPAAHADRRALVASVALGYSFADSVHSATDGIPDVTSGRMPMCS